MGHCRTVTGISAFCQFCDDIRIEANGKRLLIGVYERDLIVPAIPFRLNRIMAAITAHAPKEDPFRVLAVRVEQPGQESRSIQIPKPDSRDKKKDPEAIRFSAKIFIPIEPLEITKAGTLRVFLDTDRGEVYAGGIRLRSISDSDAQDDDLINLDAVLGAIGHYRRARERNARDLGGLASSIVEFLVRSLPAAAIAGGNPDLPTRIQVGSGRYHVFFAEPVAKVSGVRVTPAEPGIAATVREFDHYGFDLDLEPIPQRDIDFSIEIIE